jgi:nucleotide-binding universal stress UspA family protein
VSFERILVAIDGSQGANRALTTAIDLTRLAGAHLTALAIEGPLPAYAATIGEVEEVKRQKDRFFDGVAQDAREQAEAAGVAMAVEVRAGHAAELITAYAREHGTRATSCRTTCSARRPTASPTTPTARS